MTDPTPPDIHLAAIRSRVAEQHGIDADDLVLLSGSDEATITAQAQRLNEMTAHTDEQQTNAGNVAPAEGQLVTGSSTRADNAAFLDYLSGRPLGWSG